MLAVIGRAMASYNIPAMTPRHVHFLHIVLSPSKEITTTMHLARHPQFNSVLLSVFRNVPGLSQASSSHHHVERQDSKMSFAFSSHYPCLSLSGRDHAIPFKTLLFG